MGFLTRRYLNMKTKLSFANKKRLLLLFVLLIGPFLFEVHPTGNFSGYGPASRNCVRTFIIPDIVNDLPNGLTSKAKLFADDTLLYGIVVDDPGCDKLQDDLNKLEHRQHRQMEFNPSKCKTICISTKAPSSEVTLSVVLNLSKSSPYRT